MCVRLLLGGLLLLGSPVLGDIVHLKNGKKLEGDVGPGPRGGTIEVRTGEGSTVVLPESEVERIEKKQSPAEELEARLKALPAGELEPLAELLVWARDKGLRSKVKALAAKLLEIDPNHDLARKELGYVVYENRWILESELKKRKGLVRYRDEWMEQAEKDRRLREEAKRELEDLLSLAGSENSHLQEFAVRKLLAARDPVAREVFARHVRDQRDAVRWVAVSALRGFPAPAAGDDASRKISADLHALALEERDEKALEVVYRTLEKFYRRESFRLALETASSSPEERERKRAAAVVARLLLKAWVPEVCRAVRSADGKERLEVRSVLRDSLGVDLGHDAAAWLRYWRENEGRFRDE
ncbi:MAG: hypothetical protein HY721_11625 [Planctomycetes bacterium]|nr:hypothetical protein [Planctomycetota bacterium]